MISVSAILPIPFDLRLNEFLDRGEIFLTIFPIAPEKWLADELEEARHYANQIIAICDTNLTALADLLDHYQDWHPFDGRSPVIQNTVLDLKDYWANRCAELSQLRGRAIACLASNADTAEFLRLRSAAIANGFHWLGPDEAF